MHLGLIVNHTYNIASRKNTKVFPLRAPGKDIVKAPQRWHNYLDLNRWDSAQYEDIVLEGYHDPNDPSKPLETVQWYPGYPAIAKFIYMGTGLKVSLIFSTLSVLFTFLFWAFLWLPTMVHHFGLKTITLTSVIIVCWPGAFYWFAGMTEPLVALLLVMTVFCWVTNRFNWIVAMLAFASSVKQVFIPIAISLFTLEIVKSHPHPLKTFLKAFISISGFLAFGLYCWIHFGNFFTSSNMCIVEFKKNISLSNLINISHYARNFWKINGAVAFASMFFLFVTGINFIDRIKSLNQLKGMFKTPIREIPDDISLWWMALAYTSFSVLGDAFGLWPFMSMLRFQTVNIPLLLLIGLQLRNTHWMKIICLIFPLIWMFIFWQIVWTSRYWNWGWLA